MWKSLNVSVQQKGLSYLDLSSQSESAKRWSSEMRLLDNEVLFLWLWLALLSSTHTQKLDNQVKTSPKHQQGKHRKINGETEKERKDSPGEGEAPIEDREYVTRGREALLAQQRIFPFLSPIQVGLQGPLGVGLAVKPGPPSPEFLLPPPSATHSPHCAQGLNFCLFGQNYPMEDMNTMIEHHYNHLKHLHQDLYQISLNELLLYDNKTHKYRHDGHFVCESAVDYVRPGWARSIRGNWVAIVNTREFPQIVRIETCKYEDKRCEYLPPCYKSRCVQRFSYIKLICADPYRPDKQPVVDIFEVPSSCSCFVENFVYFK